MVASALHLSARIRIIFMDGLTVAHGPSRMLRRQAHLCLRAGQGHGRGQRQMRWLPCLGSAPPVRAMPVGSVLAGGPPHSRSLTPDVFWEWCDSHALAHVVRAVFAIGSGCPWNARQLGARGTPLPGHLSECQCCEEWVGPSLSASLQQLPNQHLQAPGHCARRHCLAQKWADSELSLQSGLLVSVRQRPCPCRQAGPLWPHGPWHSMGCRPLNMWAGGGLPAISGSQLALCPLRRLAFASSPASSWHSLAFFPTPASRWPRAARSVSLVLCVAYTWNKDSKRFRPRCTSGWPSRPLWHATAAAAACSKALGFRF